MPTTYHVKIGGVDFGPDGEDRVADMDVSVAGRGAVGPGSILLKYPEGESYTFLQGMKVEIYKFNGAVAFGYMGGIVTNRKYEIPLMPHPATVNVTIEVQDLNVALDLITEDVTPAGSVPLTIAAGTLAVQVAQAVHDMQFNGGAAVAWEINASDYVDNLTGGTVLPAFEVSDMSLRDVLDVIMANAYATDTTLNPGYHLALMSDGAGGVEAALVVYDKADVSSPIYTLATDPDTGAGEYAIRALGVDFKGSSLVQRKQSRWIAESGDETVITYENATSQGTYPNLFRNHTGAPDFDGFFPELSMTDEDSTTLAEATRRLEREVKPDEFPIQISTVVVDNIDARPGQVATLRIPELDIESAFAIADVKVKFLKLGNGLSDSQHTITLGKRRRTLWDTGEDGEAGQPDEIAAGIPPQPVITGITSGRFVDDFYAAVTFTHGGMGGGGTLFWEKVGGPGITHQMPIANQVSPVTVVVHNLQSGATYRFWVIVYNGNGVPSQPSDDEEETIFQIRKGVPNPSFEEVAPGDAPAEPADWEDVDSGAGVSTRVVGHVSSGAYSLQLASAGASRRCAVFEAVGNTDVGRNLKVWAQASSGTQTLAYTIVFWEWDDIGQTFVDRKSVV